MNANSGLVKTLLIFSLIAGIIGGILALTPFKLMALIPSILAFILSLIAYFIAKAKQGKMAIIYIAILVAVFSSITALVREFAIKDKVLIDQQFEEKKEQSVQEVEETDELDELQDELE